MGENKLVYLSLGSNLGDRAANLERAIDALPGIGVRVLRRSFVHETEPVDFLKQPWFLNCVVEAETQSAPRHLLEGLQTIEQRFGSRKLVPRGPRIIDLDIIFYGAEVVHQAGLEIPHPRMAERRFVLVPLNELSPEFRHPILQKTIAGLLSITKDRSEVRVWREPDTKADTKSVDG
jgi:2-amino-4-hydroxy-6-hydroxymethyldihydropteridine diphosphokinase